MQNINPHQQILQASQAPDTEANAFYISVINGLFASPKYLESKYFYDDAGDRLFQEIMACEAYYPTRCEMEILTNQVKTICDDFMERGVVFDLVELGAGDATKSSFLLKYLIEQKADFTYLPIDISENMIAYLELTLPLTLPGLTVNGLKGEYFPMLEKVAALSKKPKIILILGGNIGNMDKIETLFFCKRLRAHLAIGDQVLIGFDLKKNPARILVAYNDPDGITARFNLNLLVRINRECNANFNLQQFAHYPSYDPETGACKSFLISLCDQVVVINGTEKVHFEKDEPVFMEISQKYTAMETDEIALRSGFKPLRHLTDSDSLFMNTIWEAC